MQTIQLNISGMTCGACVHHVTQALQNVSGVQTVAVDLALGSATVSGDSLDLSQLVGAVEEEGYGASQSGETTQDKAITLPPTVDGCSCCATEEAK